MTKHEEHAEEYFRKNHIEGAQQAFKEHKDKALLAIVEKGWENFFQWKATSIVYREIANSLAIMFLALLEVRDGDFYATASAFHENLMKDLLNYAGHCTSMSTSQEVNQIKRIRASVKANFIRGLELYICTVEGERGRQEAKNNV